MYAERLELDAQLEQRDKFTTIIKVGMTPEGQFCVGRNETPFDGFLNREEILAKIPTIKIAPVTAKDPFFFVVKDRQRLVFTCDMEAWFFQQTLAPITLKTPDPLCNFVNQTQLFDYPYNLGRSKTVYIDDNNKKAEKKPFIYNLFLDIWQDPADELSHRTPLIIDPNGENGGNTGG